MRFVSCLAVVVVVGCATTARVPSDAPVREASRGWIAASDAKDVDTMAKYFAADAFVMYPQPQPTIGREANREAWAKFFARPNAVHPWTTDKVVMSASGDLAYTVGRAAGRYDGADGKEVTFGGRYIAVWQLVQGKWEIVALSANLHRPPPSMEPNAR